MSEQRGKYGAAMQLLTHSRSISSQVGKPVATKRSISSCIGPRTRGGQVMIARAPQQSFRESKRAASRSRRTDSAGQTRFQLTRQVACSRSHGAAKVFIRSARRYGTSGKIPFNGKSSGRRHHVFVC